MPALPALYRLKRLRAGLPFLLAAVIAVPGAFSQTAIAGYSSISDQTPPAGTHPFLTFQNTDTVIVVPFAFNSLGNYTLTSTSLALHLVDITPGDEPGGSGGPSGVGGGGLGGGLGGHSGGGGGDQDISNASIRIFSTLPTSLTLPPSLVTYIPLVGGANPNSLLVYIYNVSSAPTFTAGQTYYMAISIGGRLAWDMTTGASSGGTFPGDNPVTSLVGDGAPLVYYKITSGGVQSFYDNAGGFAIAAAALTAIPEPAAGGVLAGAGALGMALLVRWRRRPNSAAVEASKAAG